MSENSRAVVSITIPGRGLYRSYKYVFTHTMRTIQPDGLLPVYEDVFGEPWPEGPEPEDFDVVAAIAWMRSNQIYESYKEWRDTDMAYSSMLNRLYNILGNDVWAPSLADLAEGHNL